MAGTVTNKCIDWVKTLAKATHALISHSWRPAFFSASIALILEDHHWLKLATKLSILVVSSLASQEHFLPIKVTTGTPVVVLLGSAEFVSRYGERSPLDRCELTADIERLLKKDPRRMAVDFDLSPLYSPSDRERVCQAKLDNQLASNAGRLVVLTPFAVSSAPLMRVKHQWMKKQCSLGIHFADGKLDQSLGLVLEHSVGQDRVSLSRIAEQLHGGFSDYICDQIAHVEDPRANRWVNELSDPDTTDEEPPSEPVNFRALVKSVAVIDIGSELFTQLPSMDGSAVLFGGDWGRDDSFLTPIGTFPGVVIHAARLQSLMAPVTAYPQWHGFLDDVLIGLCFGWVIRKFWNAYVAALRLDFDFKTRNKPAALGFLIMTTFVAVYLGLVLFFFLAADHLFSYRGVVIAPLVIAMFMLVDGFVTGPMDQLHEILTEKPGPALEDCETLALHVQVMRQSMWRVLIAWVGLVTFGCAAFWAREATRKAAAYIFQWDIVVAIALAAVLAAVLAAMLAYEVLNSVFIKGCQQGHVAAPSQQCFECLGLIIWLIKSAIFCAVLCTAGSILYAHGIH